MSGPPTRALAPPDTVSTRPVTESGQAGGAQGRHCQAGWPGRFSPLLRPGLRQRGDSPGQLRPVIADRPLNERLDSREGWSRQHRSAGCGSCSRGRRGPSGETSTRPPPGTAALWHGAGHDTDCLALVGRGHALPHEAVQVRVVLSRAKVEMVLRLIRSALHKCSTTFLRPPHF